MHKRCKTRVVAFLEFGNLKMHKQLAWVDATETFRNADSRLTILNLVLSEISRDRWFGDKWIESRFHQLHSGLFHICQSFTSIYKIKV